MKTLSNDEAKELLSLCRAGKLYEVEAWILAGRSLRVPEELRTTPLRVAIDLGFYSLIQLLAIHEDNETVLNDALGAAVDLRLLELVQLLLKHGAQIKGVPLISVLRSWNPVLMQVFLDGGADVVTEYPFAVAFSERIRTALNRFLAYRESHPELDRELQEQLDRALRFFARNGNLKWISLLMWAGGNPRALGPKLDDEDDPELYTTALQEAASGHSLGVMKKLKPDPSRDDLAALLENAVIVLDLDMIRYLLEIGAKPNDKENGGSTALDRCIGLMHLENAIHWDRRWKRTKWDVHRTLDAVRELLRLGAIWRPHEKSQIKWLRKTLLECEPEVTIELLKILSSNNACSRETLKDLLSTPRIREHLSNQRWWLARLKLTDLLLSQKAKRNASKVLVVSRELLSRFNREELCDKAWSKPMRILAKEYGFSDVGLAKVCKKLGVPVPGRGYWAKKAAGRIVPQKPGLRPIFDQIGSA
jgi:hypothetical protein